MPSSAVAAKRRADGLFILSCDFSHDLLNCRMSGLGITFIPNECVENHPGVQYIPLKNWHQALYMCTLYDKWLEPPVWDFIENVVKGFRAKRK